MPTDPKILGFSNRWFKKASASAESYTLPSGWQIRLVTGPCFLATKIEAFDHRGANDFLLSADIEDIVVIFDGRPEIVTEVLKAEKDLKHFLRKRFSELGKNKNFIETLQGHLPPDAASQTRAKHILDRIEAIGLGA